MARFVTRLLFILALGATLPSAAQMLPQVVTREMPNLTLRGDGVMRFFGLKVYDVRLWSAMRAFTHTDPFALELVYDMSFSGRDIAERLKSARLWGEGVFEGQTVKRDHVLHDGDVVELHD